MSSESKSRVLYENLDTSFVNLWALLRHLSQRAFDAMGELVIGVFRAGAERL